MMVRDGVTSAFELEVGAGDVAAWYAARDPGQIVNYGVSVGHIPARMKVLGDPGKGLLPAGIGGSGTATDAQQAAIEAILREGLAQGAVAVGFGSAYTPGAPMSEIERMFRVAAEGGASAHIHMRGGLKGLHETIAAARPRKSLCTSSMSTRPLAMKSTGFSRRSRRRGCGPGCDHRSLSIRRGHDGDPVGAVRRLADLAGCTVRIAPARVDRPAPHPHHVRRGPRGWRHGDHSWAI